MARIQDEEIGKAQKLAERKNGVTRKQLADALKIDPSRAKIILARIKAKAKPAGEGAGKANRALVYKA